LPQLEGVIRRPQSRLGSTLSVSLEDTRRALERPCAVPGWDELVIPILLALTSNAATRLRHAVMTISAGER